MKWNHLLYVLGTLLLLVSFYTGGNQTFEPMVPPPAGLPTLLEEPQELGADGRQQGPALWVVSSADDAKRFVEMGNRSLALDGAGRPHVAYGGDHLYYAWHSGTAWSIQTVDRAEEVGRYTSLALDAAGYPHISYYDAANADLKYARYDGSSRGSAASSRTAAFFNEAAAFSTAETGASSWQVERVDSGGDVGSYSSLALDAAGRPHVSYYDATTGDLKYAHHDGHSWQVETVDSSGDVGRYSSLALDATGRPRISYCRYDAAWQTCDDLIYAHYDDSSGVWQTEVVDSGTGVSRVGSYTALALDAAGWPHIAYQDGAYLDLKYAYQDAAGTWQIETVDSGSVIVLVGYYASLTLDAAGRPHVSYVSVEGLSPPYQEILRYARYDGGAWQVEVVDGAGYGAQYTALALDAAGRPHVSYRDQTHQLLQYTRHDGSSIESEASAGTAAWQVETVDRAGDVGHYTSLALDAADFPHISYYDYIHADLKYAYFDGGAWQIETVDGSGDAGKHTSLALDAAGRPHISYCSEGFGDLCDELFYARYDGSVWITEKVDGAGADLVQYTSLALDAAGQPHISYYGDVGLKYAHFNGNSSGRLASAGIASSYSEAVTGGASWIIETVDNDGTVGRYSSLALDQADQPHISYLASFSGSLKYAHHDGGGWLLETVDGGGGVGGFSSLALDAAGRPHISYYDVSLGELKYAWHDGTAWQIETVDSSGGVGQYSSLALDGNGCPHIAYYDHSNAGPKYAHCACFGAAQTGCTAWTIETVGNGEGWGRYTSLALDSAGRPRISFYGHGDLRYAYRWVGTDHFYLPLTVRRG